jgi:hypothetical protein
MYSRLIARELRRRGHDVVSVHDKPGSGTADEVVFDYARSQQRALVTENVRDYRPLADAVISVEERHPGLVFTTEKRWPRRDPGALIAALDGMLKSTPGELNNVELWL